MSTVDLILEHFGQNHRSLLDFTTPWLFMQLCMHLWLGRSIPKAILQMQLPPLISPLFDKSFHILWEEILDLFFMIEVKLMELTIWHCAYLLSIFVSIHQPNYQEVFPLFPPMIDHAHHVYATYYWFLYLVSKIL